MDHPLLKDIRVRKAIQRSIDVDAIMEAAYFGVAKPSTGIVAPGLLGHRDANLTPAKPDYEGARKLLGRSRAERTETDVGYPEQTHLHGGGSDYSGESC